MSKSKPVETVKKKRSSRRKRKFLGKIDDFSKAIGLSPGRIILSLLLLGMIGFFIYTIAVPKSEVKNDERVSLSENKMLELELTVDQELAQLNSVKVSTTENFLVTIEKMADYERQLKKIESKIEPTEAQRETIDEIRLRNKSVTVSMLMSNEIPCDAEKVDLLNFCMARVDAENEETRKACRFWLCSVPAFEFAFGPSERTLQGLSNALEKYSDSYINSRDRAATLAGLMVKMGEMGPRKKDYAKKAYLALADQYAKSQLTEIKTMSTKLRELSTFGEFDLDSLEYRILWGDPTATDDLQGVFETLSKNTGANPKTWLTIIRAYERYLAVDKIEQAGEAWQKMWTYSETLEEKSGKKAIQSILTRQRSRAMFLGQDFDVTGFSASDNEPIETTHQKYFAIIFCDKGANTFQVLRRLGNVTAEQQVNYLPILAFEEKLNDVDMGSLNKVPSEIKIANFETSQKYFKAFPADFFPYVLLVDRKGEVVSLNVDVEQIESRVAKLEAQKRRKRMEAVEESQPESTGTP